MALEKWIRIKPLKDENVIESLETKGSFKLSANLKKCIKANNGARPVPNVVKTKTGQEFDIKFLLSYNEDDSENVYKVIKYFLDNYGNTLIPFASDSSGNYYCEKSGKIVLWLQSEEVLQVADNFADFLNSIYEL